MMPHTQLSTDVWITASWDEYLAIIDRLAADPTAAKFKSYYYDHQLRIEMTPLGHDHACDHNLVMFTINSYAAINNIPFEGRDNCTYRKTGVSDCQPDASYSFNQNADRIPYGTSIIDLDKYPAPDLVIEIANFSLTDDLAQKRALYEQLGVQEYWVVNVQTAQIIMFAIEFTTEQPTSQPIQQSQVLAGLDRNLLKEALRRSRHTNQGQVCAWLLGQFRSA